MTHLDEGRLRTLLDGALSEGDAEYARGHLDGCDTCRTLLAELQEASAVISVALRHLDTVDAPTGAKDSVLARVGGGLGEAWATPSTSTPEPTPASTPDLTPAEPEAPEAMMQPGGTLGSTAVEPPAVSVGNPLQVSE